MALRDALQRTWWRPRPDGLALLLWPLSLLYALLRWAVQAPWRWGWRTAWRAPVPVLVVGNWVVGGAGKTPTVMAVAKALQGRGWHPGIVSRGYGGQRPDPATPLRVHAHSSAAETGDEPLLMALRTGLPVWVGSQRVAAAQALCAQHPEVDVLISDDGLQHLALARDAELVVLDDRGAGNGLQLPAGPLREPLPGELSSRTVLLYNATRPSTPLPGPCARRVLAGIQPLLAWWQGAKSMQGLEGWRGRRVLAVAGMGHPDRFFNMLEESGVHVERMPLQDHARLTPRPWPAVATCVVMTEKDAVKLPPRELGADEASALHVATLDFEIPDSTVDALERLLLPLRAK
jgi:tetraacyldisaccharide 4'-kinase